MFKVFVAAILIALTPIIAMAALPAQTADLPKPLPEPYDQAADPKAVIAAAVARANQTGKRVLIQFGGNWCPDCRVLAGVMALPEAAPKLAERFEVVHVDVGRINKNLDIPEGYGLKLKGVPSVIILDGAGAVVPGGIITTLSDARGMTPDAIFDTLMRGADSKR
jgi:thiol-disulfide isomerase/thioredoxin